MIDPITPFEGEGGPKTLSKHDNHIMASPRVIAIYWGDDYISQSDQTALGLRLNDFFNTVCPSSYFDLLQEYGVSRPVFLDSVWFPFNGSPTNTLNNQGVADTLKKWLDTGPLGSPDKHETNLFYIIFMPAQISLDPKDGKSGFHSYTKYHTDWWPWSDSNLFYAAIPFGTLEMLTETACHELVEAFTDRDGKGWRGEKHWGDSSMEREICDLCEGPGTIFFKGFRVASFWSRTRGNCIQQKDLPPNDPSVTVTSSPGSFAFNTPTTFHVEATDPRRGNSPITGKAVIYEAIGRRSSQAAPSFNVPGSSMPITKQSPSRVLHGITIPPEYYLIFTPDETNLWNAVRISL